MDIIRVVEATKKYKDATVLSGVTVSFESGKIHGIVGRNGSGKTMLFKCICGFVPLTSGQIFVNDAQIRKDVDIPKDVGIIIEAPGFLPNYSAYGNLKLLSDIKRTIGRRKIKDTISLVGLDPDDRKRVGKFSMGMRQRLGIAQALMESPSLLILDEPFSGLDKHGVREMRELFLSLREQGKTILLATHNSEDISLLCDTVCEMDGGTLTVLPKS